MSKITCISKKQHNQILTIISGRKDLEYDNIYMESKAIADNLGWQINVVLTIGVGQVISGKNVMPWELNRHV